MVKNGKLATLNEDTCQKLRDALPEHVDIANPLDLRDDASSEHYVKTLDILLASRFRRVDGDSFTQRSRSRNRKRTGID